MPMVSPGQLAQRVNDWYSSMEWMREVRRSNTKEFATKWFGSSPDKVSRITNVIFEAMQTMRPLLVPDELEAKIKARFPVMDFEAEVFGWRLDDRIRETKLNEQLAMAVDDALLGGIGIVLVGETQTDDAALIDGRQYWLGETFAKCLDPDDVVMDTDARTQAELRCVGHKPRINRDMAIKNRLYGRDPEELSDPECAQYCMTRDEAASALKGTPQLGVAGKGNTTADIAGAGGASRTTDEMIELWTLIYWNEGKPYRVVMPANADRALAMNGKYLIYEPYDGPEFGGYHFLVPIKVRGSVIGVAYASAIRDVHDACVKVSNKLVKATLRAKKQGVCERGDSDAGKTLTEGPDGEMVTVSKAAAVNSIELGGFNKDAMSGATWLDTKAQSAGGNTNLLGGTGGTGKTLGETSILNAGAHNRVGEKLREVLQFARGILGSIAWYEWFNPLARWQQNGQTPAGPVDVEFGPELREGDSLDQLFDINVEMISIDQSDPQIQRAQVNDYLNVVNGSMQMLQSGFMNPQGLLAIGRSLYGIRTIDELFNDPERMQQMAPIMQAMMQQGEATPTPQKPPGGGGSGQSPQTQRGLVQSAYSSNLGGNAA